MNKKGVSPVIATVLLILITVAIVAILWRFLLPFVTENLHKGTSCFQLKDYVKIKGSDYTCYDSAKSETKLMIERELENYTISGIVVSISSKGESTRYNIKDKGSTSGISMFNGGDIAIPLPGAAKTYVFSGIEGTSADLGVMTEGGDLCSLGSYEIPAC